MARILFQIFLYLVQKIVTETSCTCEVQTKWFIEAAPYVASRFLTTWTFLGVRNYIVLVAVMFFLSSLPYSPDVEAFYLCRMIFICISSICLYIDTFFIDTVVNLHCVQARCFYWEVEILTYATFAVSLSGFFPPTKIYMSQAECATFCWTPAVSWTVYAAAHPRAHGSRLTAATVLWYQSQMLIGSHCEISLCPSVNYHARDPWRSCGTYTGDCSTMWRL